MLAICEGAEQERWTLLSSTALEFELGRTPDTQRRARTQRLLSVARDRVVIGPRESTRAKTLLETHGFQPLDALHLACAETSRADAFLTTDDRLLRTFRRLAVGEIPFAVANPLAWLTDFLARE